MRRLIGILGSAAAFAVVALLLWNRWADVEAERLLEARNHLGNRLSALGVAPLATPGDDTGFQDLLAVADGACTTDADDLLAALEVPVARWTASEARSRTARVAPCRQRVVGWLAGGRGVPDLGSTLNSRRGFPDSQRIGAEEPEPDVPGGERPPEAILAGIGRHLVIDALVALEEGHPRAWDPWGALATLGESLERSPDRAALALRSHYQALELRLVAAALEQARPDFELLAAWRRRARESRRVRPVEAYLRSVLGTRELWRPTDGARPWETSTRSRTLLCEGRALLRGHNAVWLEIAPGLATACAARPQAILLGADRLELLASASLADASLQLASAAFDLRRREPAPDGSAALAGIAAAQQPNLYSGERVRLAETVDGGRVLEFPAALRHLEEVREQDWPLSILPPMRYRLPAAVDAPGEPPVADREEEQS